MKCPHCLDSKPSSSPNDPTLRPFIRKGRFFRKSDGQRIPRFWCRRCKRKYSSASFSPCFGQKKRKLNTPIALMLSSGVSQRRTAQLLGVSRVTVVRKFRFQAERAKLEHEAWLKSLPKHEIKEVQFDDLETSEHTKCKPLSVALAVEPKSRKVLSFKLSAMPARGPLAKIALKRYGYRKDERPKGWDALFSSLTSIISPEATFSSDENPHYPRHLKKHFPHAKHERHKGRRGAVVGQGELKKIGFDPLFSLNHTCAMLRANLNRLFRRTWCTTKNQQGLIDHLNLYVHFHNHSLTPPGTFT